MPSWSSGQYLKFERERTRPCADLVARIELEAPRSLVDLGCGPGTSTAVLRRRWPAATVTAIDSSAEMLRAARATDPEVRWIESDLRRWGPASAFDLVFSNAALQWVPDHPAQLARLWSWVAPGGAMAFQVPAWSDPRPPWRDAVAHLVRQPPWSGRFRSAEPESPVLPLDRYFDLFARESRAVDLWETEYVHVFPGPESIVEWSRGTALRPWLDELPDDVERAQFLTDYGREVTRTYPRRPTGEVLFPFLRRFVIAYRRSEDPAPTPPPPPGPVSARS